MSSVPTSKHTRWLFGKRDTDLIDKKLFYHFTVINDGHHTDVAVWNGVKDYSNLPDKLLKSCWGRVIVKQISSVEGVAQMMFNLSPIAEFLIFWTRDDNLYHPCIDALMLAATHKRTGGSDSLEPITMN